MTQEQIEHFNEELEIDFAISETGLGRFRVNVFYQRGYPAMVLRYITAEMPRLEDLGMPDIFKELVMLKRGLILMVGAAGAGKSTTLAAMINYRNETSSDHILTIEDPIEFLHSNKKSIVNQREVGLDTKSFARALRSAVRAAPDVILVGEIRDRETMEAAIALAGTGHLCIATLHANNCAETLDRIINMFPRDQHNQIFLDLSQYLRAILSQRLVLAKTGTRVAASEVMVNTPHISELIKKGDVIGVKEAIRTGTERGMLSFDSALYNLVREGRIELEEALVERRFAHQSGSQDQLRLSQEAREALPGCPRIRGCDTSQPDFSARSRQACGSISSARRAAAARSSSKRPGHAILDHIDRPGDRDRRPPARRRPWPRDSPARRCRCGSGNTMTSAAARWRARSSPNR